MELAVGEEGEGDRVQERSRDGQMEPDATALRQRYATHSQDQDEHRRAEEQPAERHLQRCKCLVAYLDEEEAHPPDRRKGAQAHLPGNHHEEKSSPPLLYRGRPLQFSSHTLPFLQPPRCSDLTPYNTV